MHGMKESSIILWLEEEETTNKWCKNKLHINETINDFTIFIKQWTVQVLKQNKTIKVKRQWMWTRKEF